jgi:hypothetical protein
VRRLPLLGALAAIAWAAMGLLDRAAWPWFGLAALAVAAAASLGLRPLAVGAERALLAPPRRLFVGACAVAAAGLSWWVHRGTLLGNPLSIDAGIYLAEARALAHGHLGMRAPAPAPAFGLHFLFEGPDGLLYGVFPVGWPLAIAPFAALGAPAAAGPAVAAALVLAQAALGRSLGAAGGDPARGELATRASLLASLTSFARAVETADLMSHAFVAVLAAAAMALALRPPGVRGRGRAIAIGACVGWAIAARLLDGAVLAAAVGGALAWRAEGRRALGWAAAGAAPFVALLLVEQHAATGAWLVPTQTAYFERADWPPDCHRVGLGATVGCTVEHSDVVSAFGPGGYGPREALRVLRDRAGTFGEDLFGFAPLVLLAFSPVALAASAVDAVAVAFVLALSLAYALFYYGNALYFGARHLFPAAPFAWLLAARGAALMRGRAGGGGWLDTPHARGAAVLVLLGVSAACGARVWAARAAGASERQAQRSDLRRTLDLQQADRAILRSRDQTAIGAAFDPWGQPERLYPLDDGSGVVEVRRAHPGVPVFLSLPHDDVGRLVPAPPPPGLLVELERAFPSYQRPFGLSARPLGQAGGASAGAVLGLLHARPGASIDVPFDVTRPGTYRLRVDGALGPDQGDYALGLDGEPLADWAGYAPEPRVQRGSPAVRALAAGRHTLTARCTGRDPASTGYDGRLDAIVGEPLSPE